ncbi:MAG: 50S ribosomal protein L30 [Candidatus Micrarchaeota archaeon]|nr:50S ribosomal protein L30 [Candidatus Micrarchaeota archaeon]
MPCLAIVRVRGRTGIRPEIKGAMKNLSLTRVNHCVMLNETPQIRGTLNVCKDYVTWGEVSKDLLAKLLEKRGRLPGNKKLTLDYLKSKGYDGFDKLADAIIAGKAKLKDVGLKKVLRLKPPKGGYKFTKLPYPRGALGYRGEKINDLLRRMM